MDPYDDDGEMSHDEFADGDKKSMAKKMKGKDYGDDNPVEYDEIMSTIFERIEPGEGDEFGAVRPWLGAIKEPKNHPKPVKKSPDTEFVIDWVYGYRSEEARQNASLNANGQAVYPTAAMGVVFDYMNMTQGYFGGGKTAKGGRKQVDTSTKGHSDDVTAMCLSFDRTLVASGQNGQQPLICIWSAIDCSMQNTKRLPKGSRLVTAIGISPSKKFLAASDAAEKICAFVFETEGASSPVTKVSINMKVVHLEYSPLDDNLFATTGKDHLMICHVSGATVKGQKGKLKGSKVVSQGAVAFSRQKKNICYTGGSDGLIYQWDNDANTKVYENNKGPVMSLACRADEKIGELLIAGGNDKTLSLYKINGDHLSPKLWTVDCVAAPRSVDLFKGRFLLGLKNGSLVDIALTNDGTGRQTTVMTSHGDGEVWGLEVVTLPDGSIRMMTSADDNRILCYDVKQHKSLAEGLVNQPTEKKKKVKPKRGGASSMSSQPAECQSRCIAYCVEKQHLAVANNTGIVTIREVDWKLIDEGDSIGINTLKIQLFKKVKNAEWIETMVYSEPNDSGKQLHLAVGSHDNTIYLLDTQTYKKVHKLTGHSSFLTGVDFSMDGKWLRSVCGAYELLFFDVGKKKRDPSGASNTIETMWASQTTKFGWCVQGIFPAGTDGSHVNSCAMSKDQKLIASGDDYGLVNVYRNPLLEGHKGHMYRGHSEHVTSVRFSDDCKYMFSTGGQDQTTIQWRVKK